MQQSEYNDALLNYDNYSCELAFTFISNCDANSKRELFTLTDSLGNNALHIACTYGALNVVSVLCTEDVDIEMVNKNGWTPLRIASHFGYIDIVNLLIGNRANVNACDSFGNSALYYASLSCHDAVICELIKSGAELIIDNKSQIANNWKRNQYLAQYTDGTVVNSCVVV